MYTDELVLIVLGSDIEEYDGFAVKGSYKNSHIKSIIVLANVLKDMGFDIGYFDKEISDEAGYNLMKNGHIVFFNVSGKLGYLKLPKTLTEKQYKFLELIKDELKQWDFYEQRINKEDEENIISIECPKTYEVNRSKYTIK